MTVEILRDDGSKKLLREKKNESRTSPPLEKLEVTCYVAISDGKGNWVG
jgi:hypothetical protein